MKKTDSGIIFRKRKEKLIKFQLGRILRRLKKTINDLIS